MKKTPSIGTVGLACVVLLSFGLWGCGGTGEAAVADDFATSGSREADQRAEQVVAREAQFQREDDSAGAQMAEADRSLYARLGGGEGLTLIVEDFLDRVLADPRINWERRDIKAGWFTDAPEPWTANPENVERLRVHMVQFLALATGGPTRYEGRNMKEVHRGMAITNTEFDATIGDLQVTLAKFNIPDQEQKELIAIFETTREQIVEQR